jgi:hypothetical protein
MVAPRRSGYAAIPRRLLLAAIALPPLAAHAQSDWQTVVGRDLRFRLEMPSPARESTAGEKEKGHASERRAWHAERDGDMFDFDYVDYQPGWFSEHDSKVMARELGRGEAEKALPPSKYKYLRDEAVTLQGWDGYALDVEAPDGATVMMRTYIVKDRLYRMLVTVKPTEAAKVNATRFLDSLRLAQTRS